MFIPIQAGGILTEVMRYESPDSGITYVPKELRRITYNADYTKVAGDSTFSPLSGAWAYSRRLVCQYNNQDLIDTLSYYYGNSLSLRFCHTYYPEGKLQTLKRFVPGIATRDIIQDSFGYTPGINYATFREVLEAMPDGGDVSRGRIYKYPGLTGGRPDSASIEMWLEDDPFWRKREVMYYAYNNDHNPVKILRMISGFNGYPDYTEERKFYYETYDDALSLNTLQDDKELRISPNPFRDYLSILWQGKTSQNIHIRLLNMSGQEVYTARLRLAEGANRLAVPELIQGPYILQVRDETGKSWSHKLLRL